MSLVAPIIIFLLLVAATAWDADMVKKHRSRSQYMPNLPVILRFFDDILKAGSLPEDKFEYRKGERFADHETRDLSSFISVYISEEHNVILPGGTNMPKLVLPSKLAALDNKTHYLVAIVEPTAFDLSDIVLEYSMLNIHNMVSSGYFDPDYLAKLVYVPALPFDNVLFFPSAKQRVTKFDVIATFFYTNPRGDRRTEIVDAIQEHQVDVSYHHFSDLDELKELYDNSKILVNVHQTWWHHTLEELRILPALQCGVIVVSEWVPDRHVIPFSEYIIFAPYDDLAATVVDVYNKYDYYYDKIFGNSSALPDLLVDMQSKSYQDLAHRVREVLPPTWDQIAESHSKVKYAKTLRMAAQGSTKSVFKIENGTYCEFQSVDQIVRDGFVFGEQQRVPDSFFHDFVSVGPCV